MEISLCTFPQPVQQQRFSWYTPPYWWHVDYNMSLKCLCKALALAPHLGLALGLEHRARSQRCALRLFHFLVGEEPQTRHPLTSEAREGSKLLS